MAIQITTPLIAGIFVERVNRFVAVVAVDGHQYYAHVTNTGRMKELLIPGAAVLLRKADDPHRKTQLTLYMIDYAGIWVALDSMAANTLVYRALLADKLVSVKDYVDVRREVTYGQSRFDIQLISATANWYIEVKCCTLVNEGVACFPDAPTERGRKHVEELTDAVRKGYRAAVIFVAQRNDAKMFRPHDETDPNFGQALRQAAQVGVKVLAYRCNVTPRCIEIAEEIPVQL